MIADKDAEKLIEEVKSGELPDHIAIIMDGNGRWAARKGLPRLKGHMEGAEAIRRTITAARKIGLKFITLYAFSTENWSRPKSEVDGLFSLMVRFLKKETPDLLRRDIRLTAIGDISRIPEKARIMLADSMQKTAGCKSLTVVVALNYGSRQEIARAVNRILEERKGTAAHRVEAADIEAHLDTAGMPDPELLIRTSGEKRLSNFLLWQISYSEMYFTGTLWPDFTAAELCQAIMDFRKRKRRFGGLE